MPVKRLSTANEIVAMPDVLTDGCGILDLSFIYRLYRSVVELHGTEEEPFLVPVVSVSGQPLDLSGALWEQEHHWIPSFSLNERSLRVHSHIFAPLGCRGFVWVMKLTSESDQPLSVEAGWKGLWRDTYHVINLKKPMRGERAGGINAWYGGIPFVEFAGAAPLFAVAFCPSEAMQISLSSEGQPGRVVAESNQGRVAGLEGEGVRYRLSLPFTLESGQTKVLALYVGIGLEEISAVTSAVDLCQHGWQTLFQNLASWLDAHKLSVGEEQLDRLLNLNSFYNYFFSQGITLDTEELVLVTARSSKYYVSAAYWDRDAMLWSLPAVLSIDPGQARKMLEYAFTTQLRNVGVHSRFIDGVVLEPGFELDELCAPIRALSMYVRATRDISILFDRRVQAGVNRIRQLLNSKKHPSVALFETMLLPSDDLAKYPYVTYDNVLVWRTLQDLAWMYELIHDLDRSDENKELARQVHQAVMEHCVVDGPFGPMFAWAVDLKGNHHLYDDPPGSLQLLSWLEFCPPDLPAYKNTVEWIHSPENPHSYHDAPFAAPGCEHENHPFLFSVANDLLAGRSEHAIDFLRRAEMDDGIACETVDENTGRAASGRAFAACAGYLAFALSTALGAKVLGPEPEPTEKLYEPPPPGIRESIEPTRL